MVDRKSTIPALTRTLEHSALRGTGTGAPAEALQHRRDTSPHRRLGRRRRGARGNESGEGKSERGEAADPDGAAEFEPRHDYAWARHLVRGDRRHFARRRLQL